MKKRVRKQSQVESSWWYNAKSDFLVTGEVFLLDIGLLMGATSQSPLQSNFTERYIQ